MDRLGKALRINREMQFGDPGFDPRVYIESDAPDALVRELLRDPMVRQSTVRLLDLGVEHVSLNSEGALGFLVVLGLGASFPSREKAWELLGALGEAADGFPVLQGKVPSSWWPSIIPVSSLLCVVPGGAVVGVVHGLLAPASSEPLLDVALRGAGICWLLSLPLIVLALRGRSDSLRNTIFTVICNILAFPLLWILVLLLINGAFLSAPLQEREVILKEKSTDRIKSSTRYILHLAPIDARGNHVVYEDTDAALFESLSLQQRMILRYRRGRLGWEILKDVKPVR